VKKKILFIVGSVNQTSQMHQISAQLADEYDCWFSQFYADAKLINWGIRQGWLDHTILAGKFRTDAETYLRSFNLNIDYQAKQNRYDLIVVCSDLVVPGAVKATKSIWVQEGMVDEVTWLTKAVKALGLPRYFSVGTSLNGASNLCNIYCVASEGYKSFFTGMGTEANKIFVTGIPNFDNVRQYMANDFPHQDYVMVATSDIRETFRSEDRLGFIQKAVSMANGRQLLFKLHPNEVWERAEAEIRQIAPPDALIFQQGNTNEMIANCAELITQYSTVVYVGMALKKPVSSYFDVDELRRLTPIQNGGTSAQNIARICRDFLSDTDPDEHFVKSYQYEAVAYDRQRLSL
jgi:hypothetical protein